MFLSGEEGKWMVLGAICSTVAWAFYSTVRCGFRPQRLLTVCVLMAANALFTSATILSRTDKMEIWTKLLLVLTVLQPLILASAIVPALYLSILWGNEETSSVKEELDTLRERILDFATQICVFYTIHSTSLGPEDEGFVDL
mmetsp:Transcript_38/g.58  ORF Transcript_38/g.58 Transcript_38/m.58 type:complete len:142 (-) Transcript_38:2166-2591(-)